MEQNELIQVDKAQFEKLKENYKNLLTENTELRECVLQVGNVVIFLKDELLGGKIPDKEDLGALFYAKLTKNIASLIFRVQKKPEVFTNFINALQYLIKVTPKFLPNTLVKKIQD
jgi:hypothetical protein